MKIKQVALGAFSALCMSGITAAAWTLPETGGSIVALPNINESALPESLRQANTFKHFQVDGRSESKFQSVNRLTGLPLVNGVNQQLTRSDKFTPNANISGEQLYFVMLNDRPVAQYTGGVMGFEATHLRTVANEQSNSSINSNSQTTNTETRVVNLKLLKASNNYQNRVQKYKNYLVQQQASFVNIANQLGVNITAEQSYDVAVNAITVTMTQDEAMALAQLTSVKSINRVESYAPQTFVNTEQVDGEDGVDGVHNIINSHQFWDSGFKGEGIIVGVADTGINSDHPSFHDFSNAATYTDDSGITWETDDPYDHINPWGAGNYVGDCATDEFRHMCNDKLIGVRSYTRLTDQYTKTNLVQRAIDNGAEPYIRGFEVYAVAPVGEDHAGHGSHTASTAAGNSIKNVNYLYRQENGPGIVGSETPLGDMSGVAPHANIIMYQVCISAGGSSGYAGCLGDVMLSALEDAIEDGVDVLSWSLGGAAFHAWDHPIGQAFLSARESGMHIAISAGNNGWAGSVSNTAPWLVTVGATRTNRREHQVNPKDLQRDAQIPATLDGVEFPMSLSSSAKNISGEHINGEAVLAAYMGACVNGSCTPALVCKAGYEMLADDLCYQTCSDEEFRDTDTNQCESFGLEDLPDQHDSSNCLIGTKWVGEDEVGSGRDWGCLDINHEVPSNIKHRASICLNNDDVVFPSLTDNPSGTSGVLSPERQLSEQRYYCPEVEVEKVHPYYRGVIGQSKGIVCAYGVETYWETEFAGGRIIHNNGRIVYNDGDSCKNSEEENCVPEDWDGDGENSNIEEPSMGQCRVKSPEDRADLDYSIYAGSTGPGILTTSFGKVSSRPAILSYKSPLTNTATTQGVVVGKTPEMRVFKGDPYCENLAEWRDPADVFAAFDFDDKILFCARGKGDNISRAQKRDNAIAAAQGFDEDSTGALNTSVVLYNDWSSFNTIYELPSKIPFLHIQKDTWLNDFKPLFETSATPSDLVELQRKRVMTIPTLWVGLKKMTADSDDLNHTLANYTSKGPHQVLKDIMPVDVLAPGNNIYAAWSDDTILDGGMNSADWGFSDGTSMATPVVAGTLALFKQARPLWTEAERESALSMTAKPVRFRTTGLNETDYDANNPNHNRTPIFQPKLDEDGGLIYDDNGEVVMDEIYIYRQIVNINSWHVGSGLIDIEAAINPGLVLNETIDNFLAANPNEGGDPRQLNMPYLFDGSCADVCTWLRTFKATQDGSWTVNVAVVEASVTIESSITNFSLKAGEKVTIMFTAKLDRSIANSQQDNLITGTGFTGGEVTLVPADIYAPTLRLPVGISLDFDKLPTLTRANVTADSGKFPIDVSAPKMSTDTLSSKVFQQSNISYVDVDENGELTKSGHGVVNLHSSLGRSETWIGQTELGLDQTPMNFDFHDAYDNTSVKLIWIDVPEGTKMLAVDILRKVSSNVHQLPDLNWVQGSLQMVVGRDLANPGELNFLTEGVCSSIAEKIANFCYIMDPTPGRYWILLQNANDDAAQKYTYLKDTYQYAVALVSNQMSANMILDTPTQVNPAQGNLAMDLVYSVPMKKHEVTYAVAELYSNDAVEVADMGTMPIRLYRQADPINIEFSRDSVSPGSYIKVDIDVAANLSGATRPAELTFNLPDGVTYVRGTLDGDPRFVTGYEEFEDGDGMTLSFTQPNTYRMAKGYIQTSNINPDDPNNATHPYVLDGSHNYDPMCRTPDVGNNIDGTNANGGYLDLAKLNPVYSAAMYGEDTYFDMERLFAFSSTDPIDFSLYGGPRTFTEFKVSPAGYITAGQAQDIPYMNPYNYMPAEILIAPLHRAGHNYKQTVSLKSVNDLKLGESMNNIEGITFALFSDGVSYKALVEWDNAYTVENLQRLDDSYDFQAWVDLENINLPGNYEIIFAYDNLNMIAPNFDSIRNDAIGFQGQEADRHFFGWIKPPRKEFFAFNNVHEVIQDDLVICYDYYGPDYSATNYSFWVRVDDNTSGEALVIEVEQRVGSNVQLIEHNIKVPSQLTLADFGQVIIEQGSQTSIAVYYADSNLTPNTINVSSEHLNVTVDGDKAGSMLTIDADCSFTGSTQIRVEVVDNYNANDRATKIIEVQVTAVDGYSAGSCSTVITSDEPIEDNEQEAAGESDTSGGSFGLFLFLLVGIAGFRFKKIVA